MNNEHLILKALEYICQELDRKNPSREGLNLRVLLRETLAKVPKE